MSQVEELERDYLAGLRAALEPSPEDGIRIRRQLTAALALPLAPVAESNGLRRFAASRAVQLLGVGLVSGVLGVAIGYRMGLGQRTSGTVAAVAVTETKQQAQPADEANESAPTENGESRVQAANHPKRALPSATAVASNALPVAEDPLIEEMQLLKRAERAIRANNGLLALAMLRELEQRFPKGQLLEEREAARVMANCELNPPEMARDLGGRFVSRYPKSVYLERVRPLCKLSEAPVQSDVTESEAPGN
jgi:hypothetical protein